MRPADDAVADGIVGVRERCGAPEELSGSEAKTKFLEFSFPSNAKSIANFITCDRVALKFLQAALRFWLRRLVEERKGTLDVYIQDHHQGGQSGSI